MSSSVKLLSIKSLIVWGVIAITSVSLAFSSGINLYSQISTYKSSLKESVIVFADLISGSSVDALLLGDIRAEQRNLSVLSVSNVIENVHIYRVLKDGSLEFFLSYNKQGIAPVKERFSYTEELA